MALKFNLNKNRCQNKILTTLLKRKNALIHNRINHEEIKLNNRIIIYYNKD